MRPPFATPVLCLLLLSACTTGPTSPSLPDGATLPDGLPSLVPPDPGLLTPCANGRLDINESDVDCGFNGVCEPCADGKACKILFDCKSSVCKQGVCQAGTCSDGARNQDETNADCGGIVCGPCLFGQRCKRDADCKSGKCDANGACTQEPTCYDKVLNQDEADVDCGGTSCIRCELGKACRDGIDCATQTCKAGKCVPFPRCDDGERNGQESDVDCGGMVCPRCAVGKACGVHQDCQGYCRDGACYADPSCDDGLLNQDETAIDCGGVKCKRCPDGAKCFFDSDCHVDSTCQAFVCTARPSCFEQVRNLDESDVDCGGARCARCLAGSRCNDGSDCLQGACKNGVCVEPTCNDGVRNQDEVGVDCGGLTCPLCVDGKRCDFDFECVSARCRNNLCVGTHCLDMKLDGDESDVDCGGAACDTCAAGRVCRGANDCLGGRCDAGRCFRCKSPADCDVEQNCLAGSCVSPQGDCESILAVVPGLPDGIYWTNHGGPERTYCDMRGGRSICYAMQAEVFGVSHDGTGLTWRAQTLLDEQKGTCELWAVRDSQVNIPLGPLVAPFAQMSTCAALGFPGDVSVGACRFGDVPQSTCDFPIFDYYRFGNHCGDCRDSPGDFDHWEYQGVILDDTVISDWMGNTRTVCRVR